MPRLSPDLQGVRRIRGKPVLGLRREWNVPDQNVQLLSSRVPGGALRRLSVYVLSVRSKLRILHRTSFDELQLLQIGDLLIFRDLRSQLPGRVLPGFSDLELHEL